MKDTLISLESLGVDEQERLHQEMLAVPTSLPEDQLISQAPKTLDVNDSITTYPVEQYQEKN